MALNTLKFGVGIMIATLTRDSLGNALAVPQPVRLGALQDVSTDYSFESKSVFGEGQFALDRGRGKAKLAFSAKTANINAVALAGLHFGVTPTVGFKGPNVDVGAAVPAAGPYTIVAAPPNTGTFVADMGVRDTNGNDFKRVAAAPAAGQYTVNEGTGTYTFAAADANKAIVYSYEYSTTQAGSGNVVALTNTLMGYAPTFSVILLNSSKGNVLSLKLNACQSDKLALPFKNDDYVIADFGFEATDDGTGNIGYIAQK